MKTSIIYRNIFFYRTVLKILYKGKYEDRFHDVIKLILPTDKKIIELCFADIHIAEFCSTTKKKWIGYDLNQKFVEFANKKGHEAYLTDLLVESNIKSGDLCIMMGSLYHFNRSLKKIISKMLNTAPRIIISEPIVNFSNNCLCEIFAFSFKRMMYKCQDELVSGC